MNVHPRSVRLAALTVAALLAACTSVTSSTRPSEGTTPAADLQVSMDAVAAGRYRLAGFDPPMTMELDGSWQVLAKQSG